MPIVLNLILDALVKYLESHPAAVEQLVEAAVAAILDAVKPKA